jgi:dipeptidyl aminopeptidase/acylaminoacyl peptidase
MAWDGTELHLARIGIGENGLPFIKEDVVIAGDIKTAIFAPQFSPDGRYLSYISDASGWGNIDAYDLNTKRHVQVTHGVFEHARPAWLQGIKTYGWSSDSKSIYLLRAKDGVTGLYAHEVGNGAEKYIGGLRHYTHLEQVAVAPNGNLAMIASSPQMPPRIISYSGKGYEQIHRRASSETILPDDLSKAEHISWIGHDGQLVYGVYYPPTENFIGDGAPPLIVIVHGGPTAQKALNYDDEAQFFATRGYAVLYPNHRGSTGYGREYCQALRGAWGVYDVEDSASGALALVERGLADPTRLVIMGGSAGGFTALQSLVTKPNFYRAGIVRYGVANQFMLAMDTHKFESRYNDSLLGALPQAATVYRERSPLFHAHRIKDALILFQGSDDAVVPQNQSDTLVNALRMNGVPHEYVVYAGEGHGFRKPENVKDYYERILRFLAQMVLYV